jgi:hypothetical protein
MKRPDIINGGQVLASAHTAAGWVVLLFRGDRQYVTARVVNGAPVERYRHTSRTGALEDFRMRAGL